MDPSQSISGLPTHYILCNDALSRVRFRALYNRQRAHFGNDLRRFVGRSWPFIKTWEELNMGTFIGFSVFLIVVLIVMAVVVVMIAINIYNRLVTLRNRYQNAFSQIDVQLRRRYDLIPNLVETVKGYMKHERETLEAVIAARNSAITASRQASQSPGDPAAMQQLAGAEATLTGTLGRLFALSEAYPDLKANQNMAQLMEELRTTENQIAFARQGFNDSVTRYNTAREVFPNSIIAGSFNFGPAELLEVVETPEMRETPRVSF